MTIESRTVLITNVDMRKAKDGSDSCTIGILSLDDGQKFDLYCKDSSVYATLTPFVKANVDLALSNSQYGMRLAITKVNDVGDHI